MSEQGGDVDAGDPACSCKIGRNAASYGLSDLDRRLLAEREEGASLRDLERVVNEALLAAALRRADAEVVGDVASVYETLTDDDASAGERTALTDRLSRAGVDVEALHEDFVSYQTVRNHLRECLDVETGRRTDLSLSDARGTIEWARSRSEGIVERTVERLADADEVAAGDVDVSHTARVSCADCGASYPVERFLERGGCECGPAAGDA